MVLSRVQDEMATHGTNGGSRSFGSVLPPNRATWDTRFKTRKLPQTFYIHLDIIFRMKPLTFLADTLKVVREFPHDARQDVGHQLSLVQQGIEPDDFKSLSLIGAGVQELRIWCEQGTFRVVYLARLPEAVYVLHAFQKKTQTTSKSDIELAARRYRDLMKGR